VTDIVMTAAARPSASSGREGALELDRFLEALDPRRMGPRLASAFGGGAVVCHVLDAKYQPGVGATVLYDLGGQLLRADLLPPSAGAGSGRATVLAPGVSVSAFPADPELRTLPRLMAPGHLGRELASALDQGSATSPSRRSTCRTTLLRYRPGKRATLSVVYRSPPGRYVAKAYHDPVKAAAVAAESNALASISRSACELRFAPTVAHLPELGVVVQREVRGVPLTALVAGRHGPLRAAPTAVRRAAHALAELHEAPAATQRLRSVERELRRFEQRARWIGDVDPAVGGVLGRLAERLTSSCPDLPAPELGTVHGDCKPSQFLLGPGHVYLLDVDHLGISDLATDVGTFMASLRQLALRRCLTGARPSLSAAYDELAETFLAAYLEGRGGKGEPVRIRWQEAVALERKALRAFARAPRSPLAAALAAQGHRCLDTSGAEHGTR
jgi:hypothetical protein